MRQSSTRVLVLSAGIAGLLFTLRLSGKVAHKPVRITLVDEADTFTIRPRLHEFATCQHIFSRPFRDILSKTQVQFVQGHVTTLDPAQHRVRVLDQQQEQHELEYDYLVYALGSKANRQNAPGVESYAFSLDARGPFSAVALREKLSAIGTGGGQVVICGAGATGIETAAQVASVYPQIKVSLLTRGAFAHSWDRSVADIFRQRLLSLGVEIVEHSEVSAVHAQSVTLEGGRELACDLCIWTTGFAVPPLARESGLRVNERGQVLVNPFLRSISHQEIFAIGDSAMPAEKPGVPHVRMSAFTASIMAAHGADCLSALLAGKTPKPLSFAYVGQAVALGQNNALFLPLAPDDKPRHPYITGRLGAFTREAFVGFVVKATLAQRRFPGMFSWVGKRRYERELQRREIEKHPAQHAHHLS